MSGKIELALDDIIKQNPRGGRGRGRGGGARGRGRGRGSTRGGTGAGFPRIRQAGSFTRPGQIPEGPWRHDRYDDEGGFSRLRSGSAGPNATSKLLVTNLDYGVSDSDIKELFSEFGPIRRAAVHYDKSGRSLGSADVVYERRVDGMRAVKRYNNVPLDGRPMKIQMVGSGTATPSTGGGSVFSRVQITPTRGSASGGGGGGRGAGRRGRGARGRGGGGARRQPPPSQEDLDAELDAYVNKMDSN